MFRPNLSQQEGARPYTLDEPVVEASRKIMASLVTRLWGHEQDLSEKADVVSVHESRKGIRRLRTALALFAPHYELDVLTGYRKRFRKVMRRLARSRDVAVFLIKLDRHFEEKLLSQEPRSVQTIALKSLQDYWREQQSIVDEKVLRYLAKGGYNALLTEFEDFTRPVRPDEASTQTKGETVTIGQVAPVMVQERVSSASSLGDSIETASLKRLHALRIQCKELRYTLEFFEPVMAPPVGDLIDTLKPLLTHLGDLNDARVHLRMLDEAPQGKVGEGALIYRRVKERELESLIAALPPLWVQVDGAEWHAQLAESLSPL